MQQNVWNILMLLITNKLSSAPHQGAVESIALKDPKERTKMFECISQSREYAAEYNRRKEALQKAKEDTQFLFNKKKSATVERKQVSKEKAEVPPHKTPKLISSCFSTFFPPHQLP